MSPLWGIFTVTRRSASSGSPGEVPPKFGNVGPLPPPKDIKQIYLKERAKYEKEQRLLRYQRLKGSKYPAIDLEPYWYERHRLHEEGGFTDRFRRLRHQYLQDMKLAPDEPRYVPELFPRNIFRRLFAWPWDKLFNMLRPVFREPLTSMGRRTIPRLAVIMTVFYYTVYWIKYRPSTWERQKGAQVYPGNKPTIHPDDPFYFEDPPDDYWHDKGFKSRKALRDLDNSSSGVYYLKTYQSHYAEGDKYGFFDKVPKIEQ